MVDGHQIDAELGKPSVEPRFLDALAEELNKGAADHYDSVRRFVSRSNYLSIPAIVVSALVASSAFTTLTSLKIAAVAVATQLLSLIAVLLAAIDKAKNYAGVAGEHKKTAASLTALRDEVRFLRASSNLDSKEVKALLVRKEGILAGAPSVPQDILETKRDPAKEARVAGSGWGSPPRTVNSGWGSASRGGFGSAGWTTGSKAPAVPRTAPSSAGPADPQKTEAPSK